MITTQINHPDYYKAGNIETIDVIDAWDLNFNLGNVIKYIARAGKKPDEDALTTLQKAKWYLDREVNRFNPEFLVVKPEISQ